MERLNYHHLRCFWAAAREGSIAKACPLLGLTQPTISKQIGELEEAIGEALFRRVGRGLVLTDLGRTVQAYADDIFALGRELTDAIEGTATGKPLRLHVGISDAVPKLLSRRVLESTLTLDHPVRLVCHEGPPERLIADLVSAHLDLVLTDAPPPPSAGPKPHHRLLIDSPVAFFGAETLVSAHAPGFPRSLDGAPVLLPTEHTQLRRSIDAWLEEQGVRPRIVAEFEDSALIKSFGEAGHGLFVAPTNVSDLIGAHYNVRSVGELGDVRERVFAITAERRVTHPAIGAIIDLDRA